MDFSSSPNDLKRLGPNDDLQALLHLMRRAFADMEGRIDPPSSLNSLTVPMLSDASNRSEIWAIGDKPLACMILTRRPSTLYMSKLAVDPSARGKGHARRLIDHALTRTRELGLPSLSLQTRVELTENQRFFEKFGFQETTRTSHPGYDRPTSITYHLGT